MKRIALILIVLFGSTACYAGDTQRTITVYGQGTATAKPDSALLHVAVVERSKDLGDAQDKAAKKTAAILELAERQDVNPGDIDTTGAAIRPDYRWNRDTEQQEFHGYVVTRDIAINVKDIGRLGALIEGAVRAGANQVTPPVLQSSGRDDAHRDALEKAALDARSNAEVLARQLGVSLGSPVSINAGRVSVPVPMQQRGVALAMEMAGAEETYNAGDLTFNANVTVVFELIP